MTILHLPDLVRPLARRPCRALAPLALVLPAVGIAVAFLWAEHHLDVGRRALDRHAFAAAQHHFELYLKVHFRSATGHLLAAQAARRRDAYGEAESHLADCLRLGGMTEATALERLLLTAQQGDLADMEGLLKARTSPGDPDAVPVLEALAKGYGKRFWQADALACLNELLQRQPRHAQALLMRARAWEDRAEKGEAEREADALRDYEQVIELAPSVEARLGRAGALYRLGRPRESLSEYERLGQDRPDDPDVLLGLARCRYALHDVDEARRPLDALLAQQPDHAAGLLERGRLALHAGDQARAEAWLSRAAALAPAGDCEPYRLLGQCLEVERKDEEARRCSDLLRDRELDVLRVERRILQANRDPHDIALRYDIALDLMRLGRERDGVAALFLVLEQQPRHGPAHAALADYFQRAGQPDRAARHRRAAANPGGR
jgi:tetratricopeptide (TPR) repeat protein